MHSYYTLRSPVVVKLSYVLAILFISISRRVSLVYLAVGNCWRKLGNLHLEVKWESSHYTTRSCEEGFTVNPSWYLSYATQRGCHLLGVKFSLSPSPASLHPLRLCPYKVIMYADVSLRSSVTRFNPFFQLLQGSFLQHQYLLFHLHIIVNLRVI